MNKTTTAKLVIEPLNMEEKEVIAAIEAYVQDDNKIGLHTYVSKLPKDMVITVIRYSFHLLKTLGYSATSDNSLFT